MASSPTYIEISPTRLSICNAGRRAPMTRSTMIAREEWEAWHAGQSRMLEQTFSSLREPAGRSGRTTIFYHSPSLSCNLYSCPSSVKDKTGAAHLALAELSSLDLEENPWCIQPIAADRAGKARRSHLLIAADTESCVQRLKSLCPGDGNEKLIPLESALIASSVEAALEASRTDRPIVIVHFGQSRSVITAAYNRQLLLVRPVDVGTDRLIEALASTLELPVQQAFALAHEVLFGGGLPSPGQQIVAGDREFTSADVLPAIQPVLQRLLVEVRQSIRFGLSGLDSPPIALLRGSGAAISNLADALGRELQITCDSDHSRPAELSTDIAFAAEAVDHGLRLTLRCRAESAVAAAGSSRLALYAGSVVAVAIGLGYGSWTIDETRRLEPKLTELTSGEPNQREAPQIPDASEQIALVSSIRQVIESIDYFAGPQTDVASALRELCVLIADEAVLTDIEIAGARDNTTCRIRGYLLSPAADGAQQIRSLIDSLRESPFVESVRLDGTEVSVLEGRPTQYFAASIELAATPRQVLTHPATLASVSPERSP